ncbi:dihydrolipoamide acetyltransferase family protein [Rhodococcus sp. Q]|uniref:dihydrolipoamide acetyltransferase family protein n=1 Tax=Rhodococcus sp. Q TaxID=2502252 RepID=UPI0010F8B4B4|nr:dihydrolipoamide acetyltransferase family protein [Rhodococcus sp. Q]
MTVHEFRLPDLGEGLTDAELVSWTVAAGDVVTLNQPIAEVETAKAGVELPSPFAGVVVELLAEPGTIVAVGAPLIRIDTTDLPEQAAPHGDPVLVGYGPTTQTGTRRRRPPPAPRPDDGPQARPDATPSARRLARELGVDLATVRGSGPGGAVTVGDLGDVGNIGTAEPGETRTPVHGVRKRTADAMVRSAFTAPHVTVFVTADVTASMDLLDRLRATAAFTEITLTPLALVAKAMLVSLRTHPELNSSWDEERQEIVTFGHVNLGVAVATDRGLLVPTVRDAHAMTLLDLAQALSGAAAAARAGTSTAADLTGGTITVTNVGVFGVDAGTPILVPGQAAILCLGAVARRPWVVDDRVVPRWVTTLGLSFDHRVVDGEQGSRFLADVATLLGGSAARAPSW